MNYIEKRIFGLVQLGDFIHQFLNKKEDQYNKEEGQLAMIITKSVMENPWFTKENVRFSLQQWADLFTSEKIENWLGHYKIEDQNKRIGLILAGNIPMVGFHDILCVVLSHDIPIIKLSSKDKQLIPFLLEKWREFSDHSFPYELVDRLVDFEAVIATGSNNTAKYLEFYFKNKDHIIRKSRTSVAVLDGYETNEELRLLARDIFLYFGLGCRNVSRLFLPKDFKLDRLFENFIDFSEIINHNSYANNYDYYKAIYLLNQENFWDNNFVMLKEEEQLFSPLSVLNFTRYENLSEVQSFLIENKENIQCIVAKPSLGLDSVNFGEAQKPGLEVYADNVDTMKFLELQN